MLLVGLVGIFLGGLLSLQGTLSWLLALLRPRPAPTPDVTVEELVKGQELSKSELVQAWSQRCLVVHHDENGIITGLTRLD